MHKALHVIYLLSIWHFLLTTWILAVTLVVFGTYRSLLKLKKTGSPLRIPDADLPPLSILKPVKGLDEGLEKNIESFFLSDYPQFELLISVADALDPAIPVIKKLIRKYPSVAARLYVGESNIGLNPKINNIFRSYQDARNDVILISDSNTRVAPDYLRRFASQFGNDVAMQSSIVFGAHPAGLGGALEATSLNTYYARSMIGLETIGHPCVLGKAMMFRKSIFENQSGWPALSSYIAEDYEAGHRLHLAGLKVQTTREPIEQFIGRYSVRDFWNRHVRWGRLRKVQAPLPFSAEFLVGAMASGVIGAAAFSHLFHVPALMFFAIHLAAWFTCDALVMSRVGQAFTPATLPVWLLREILHLPLLIHISLGNSIQWRGRTIRLQRGGIAKPQPNEALLGEEEAPACSRA